VPLAGGFTVRHLVQRSFHVRNPPMKSIAIGMTLFVSTFAMAQDWVDITPGGPTSSWVTQGGEWEAAGGVLTGKTGTGETAYYMSDMIYADFELECDVLVAEGAMGGVVF